MGQFKIPIYVINFGLDLQKMVPYKMDICQIIQVEFGAGRIFRFGAISCNINKYFTTFLNRGFYVIRIYPYVNYLFLLSLVQSC